MQAKKRQKVGTTFRKIVWQHYLGKESQTGECFLCGDSINVWNFEVGHDIPHCAGGEVCIENCRPVCTLCNRSQGAKRFEEFRRLIPSTRRQQQQQQQQSMVVNVFKDRDKANKTLKHKLKKVQEEIKKIKKTQTKTKAKARKRSSSWWSFIFN
jgi:esterase/lipase